jgi:hypothetical protein
LVSRLLTNQAARAFRSGEANKKGLARARDGKGDINAAANFTCQFPE